MHTLKYQIANTNTYLNVPEQINFIKPEVQYVIYNTLCIL